MKNISLFAAIIICLITISCSQEKDKNDPSLISKNAYADHMKAIMSIGGSTTSGFDGKIQYKAFGMLEYAPGGSTVYQFCDYDCQSQFFKDATITTLENVGTLNIGSVSVVPATANGNSYWYSTANRTDPANASQFGSTVTFAIAGGGSYSGSSVSFYVPEEIYLDTVPYSSCKNYTEISVSKLPHRIYWNQDASNPNGVAIMSEYNGPESNNVNSSFSSLSFYNAPIVTPDLGYYDLTMADLSGIPLGAIVTIHVGRGNEDVIVSGSKNVKVEGYASTLRSYVLVP